VWLGGDYNEISYIEQQITVPVSSPYMSFWRWMVSSDTCGHDYGRVLINSTEVDVDELCQANNTNGWVQKVIDLSAYAGESVLIQIRAECNGTLNSNLFVDHVAFQSSLTSSSHPIGGITGIEANYLKQDVLDK
jgi:hypothetical protein